MEETKSCLRIISRTTLGAVLGTIGGAIIGAIVFWFLGAALSTMMNNPNAYHGREDALSYAAGMIYSVIFAAMGGMIMGVIWGVMYYSQHED